MKERQQFFELSPPTRASLKRLLAKERMTNCPEIEFEADGSFFFSGGLNQNQRTDLIPTVKLWSPKLVGRDNISLALEASSDRFFLVNRMTDRIITTDPLKLTDLRIVKRIIHARISPEGLVHPSVSDGPLKRLEYEVQNGEVIRAKYYQPDSNSDIVAQVGLPVKGLVTMIELTDSDLPKSQVNDIVILNSKLRLVSRVIRKVPLVAYPWLHSSFYDFV